MIGHVGGTYSHVRWGNKGRKIAKKLMDNMC